MIEPETPDGPKGQVIFGEGHVPSPMRRMGYVISIVFNLILIWVVVNLVGWDFLPFLTEDFSEVVPIMVTSLAVSIFVNLIYIVFDPPLIRRIGDIVMSGASLAALIKLNSVFPFDFSADVWRGLTRAVLILIGIALVVSIIANLVKLIVAVSKEIEALDI